MITLKFFISYTLPMSIVLTIIFCKVDGSTLDWGGFISAFIYLIYTHNHLLKTEKQENTDNKNKQP